MTFSEAVELYRVNLLAKRRKDTTLEWYDEQFTAYRRWAAAAGHGDELPAAEMIDAFVAAQDASGLKPSTVHARYRALRALFRFLEKRRKMRYDDNPIHLTEAPFVPKEIRRYVTVDDLHALLAGITGASWIDRRDRLIIGILFYSGLRLAELCALQVSDIDTTGLSVTVRKGKGDKDRIVPTTTEVVRWLTAYLYSRPNHTPQLLLASDGFGGYTGPLHSEGVRQMLIRRCKRSGINPPYSPHCFRHGFAMWTLNSGVRLTTVSEMMGHSDPDVTHEIYAHTTLVTVRREYDEALKRTKTD